MIWIHKITPFIVKQKTGIIKQKKENPIFKSEAHWVSMLWLNLLISQSFQWCQWKIVGLRNHFMFQVSSHFLHYSTSFTHKRKSDEFLFLPVCFCLRTEGEMILYIWHKQPHTYLILMYSRQCYYFDCSMSISFCMNIFRSGFKVDEYMLYFIHYILDTQIYSRKSSYTHISRLKAFSCYHHSTYYISFSS